MTVTLGVGCERENECIYKCEQWVSVSPSLSLGLQSKASPD